MNELAYYFSLFIIYSCLGWIYETILCSTEEKTFVNRGFLNGPVCPIYGSGAVLVISTLGKIQNPILVFLLGILLTGVLEYLTSFIMEKLFNAKWWDYSERRFNIKGRVCLLGAVVFGLMTLLAIYILNPIIMNLLLKIDYKVLYLTSIIFAFIMIIDLIFTVSNLIALNSRLAKLQNAINKYIEYTKIKGSKIIEESKLMKEQIAEESRLKKDRLKESFNEIFEESEFYTEKIKNIISIKNFQDKRIIKAFPHFKSTKYHEAFEKFKDALSRNRGVH